VEYRQLFIISLHHCPEAKGKQQLLAWWYSTGSRQFKNNDRIFKDTIYTKLALMPLIDDNLGHTFSGLTQIGNIIAKIF
jgi:hypothetical protein